MPLTTDIEKIARSISHLQIHNRSREATKTALVLPLIAALGYDIFNPEEVVAEYPDNNGASVDFAIFHNGKPEIIIACSAASGPISAQEHPSLSAIYQNSGASFLILTNGVNYRVHSRLHASGGIDPIPLITFSVNQINLSSLYQLQRFAKEIFDPEQILADAKALKWEKQLMALFKADLLEPSPAFVRYCATHTYGCLEGEKIPAEFTSLVRPTYQTFIKNFITNRLQEALNNHLDAIEEEETVENISTEPNQTSEKISKSHTQISGELAERNPLAEENPENTPPLAQSNYGLTIEQITDVICQNLHDLIRPDQIIVKKKKVYYSVYFENEGKKPQLLTRIYFTNSIKRQLRYTSVTGKKINKSFGNEAELKISLIGLTELGQKPC